LTKTATSKFRISLEADILKERRQRSRRAKEQRRYILECNNESLILVNESLSFVHPPLILVNESLSFVHPPLILVNESLSFVHPPLILVNEALILVNKHCNWIFFYLSVPL